MTLAQNTTEPRKGIPRGLATSGPVLFAYGFRPFFLGASIWAAVAMVLWIGSLVYGLPIGGAYGAPHWHIHELLFGFAPAVLAGFLLTAVPNWTGRLPVSGRPLIWLFGAWVAGRAAMLLPDVIGLIPAAAIDVIFMSALLAICLREIIAGRKWKDLKVMAGVGILALANAGFHYAVITNGDVPMMGRAAISAYIVLIMVIGGRIIPSFTRNWLNKMGRTAFPVPFNGFDIACLWVGALALVCWVAVPQAPATLPVALAACVLHAIRLYRWRGWPVRREPLLFVLHTSYAFVPLGLAAIALQSAGLLGSASTTHLLTVGAVASMMIAVMARATRGHTGRPLTATKITSTAYTLICLAAISRPLADLMPAYYDMLIAAAGGFWIAAFGAFLLEHAPMLALTRRAPLSGS